MNDAPKLTDTIAAKLDASDNVRDDWRKFFGFTSVRWTLTGVAAAGMAALTAAFAAPALLHAWPFWGVVAGQVLTGIGTFYGVLTKQSKLNPDQPKDEAS